MRILVVGTVSNVGAVIRDELKRVLTALDRLADVAVFLVESDSSDDSIQELSVIQEKDSRVSFVPLGNLKSKIPHRIERIRFCRNQYVEFIRTRYQKESWDFVVVVDLDGMNNKVTEEGFRSTIENPTKWSACFANQTKGYYDLYALRCEGWVDGDVFSELRTLKNDFPLEQIGSCKFIEWLQQFNHFDRLREKAIYSKMRRIRPKDSWVKVESAFGGLGVYRTEVFLKYNYDFQNLDSEVYSEHIDLHYQCNRDQLELFINPLMVNSNWNVYNINRIKFVRFLKEFKKFIG
jgi:hypothetical protein